jgi:hypothetical protein
VSPHVADQDQAVGQCSRGTPDLGPLLPVLLCPTGRISLLPSFLSFFVVGFLVCLFWGS